MRTLPNDIARCGGNGCDDRQVCARWMEHDSGPNPYQVFAAFDSHRGKDCEHLIELLPSRPSRRMEK